MQKKKQDTRQNLSSTAPFSKTATEGLSLGLGFDNIYLGTTELAVVNESWWGNKEDHYLHFLPPDDPGAKRKIIFDRSSEDTYDDPAFRTGSSMQTGNRCY